MAYYKPLTEDNVKDFPNFSYSEFACHCGGKYCNGFPVAFSYDLARNLQTIRDHFGKPLHITSPVRDTRWNSEVGGTKNSPHTKGWACDFYINGVSYNELASYVKTLPYFHYCYRVKPNQQVIHYDITPPSTDYIIEPVARDESKKQLKVLSHNLEVRRSPDMSSDFRGFVQKGAIYNYYDVKQNDYTWYQIDDIQWIPNINNCIYVYPEPQEGEDEKMIEELQKQVEELTTQVNNLVTLNKALQEENNKLANDLDKFEKIYTCEKDDYYKFKIKMYKDESLYVKGVE
jgi:hypothetical protein